MRKNAQKTKEFTCGACGVIFSIKGSPSKFKRRKYCSEKCQKVCRRNSIEVKCKHCDKLFMVQPHRFESGRGKFCSKECQYTHGFDDIVKLKMSLQRKGKPTNRTGEKCHFWKGGVCAENKKIRMSLQSRMWREKIFERDNYTCQMCNVRGGTLQADHIKPFSLFPELRFDLSNGRTLCVECHKQTDTYGGKIVNYESRQILV